MPGRSMCERSGNHSFLTEAPYRPISAHMRCPGNADEPPRLPDFRCRVSAVEGQRVCLFSVEVPLEVCALDDGCGDFLY